MNKKEMQEDPGVGANGEVEEIEKVSYVKFLKMLHPKIKRFKERKFIHRVFVLKRDRSKFDMKQAAMNLIQENIARLYSHQMTFQKGISTLYRRCLYCSVTGCPQKTMIILLCGIENGLHDNLDILRDYQGFMIFSGSLHEHRKTKSSEHDIISDFESLSYIYEDHTVGNFNLAGIPVKKNDSVYKNPETVKKINDPPELKFGLAEIQIVKQIVRQYQCVNDDYIPKDVLEYVQKVIQDIKTNYRGNEFNYSKTLFAESMLDLWYNVQMEGKHQCYPNMEVVSNATEQSIGVNFEIESGIKAKKLMITLKCWDVQEAQKYCSGRWRKFCELSYIINPKDVLAWIYPSIDFTGSDDIKARKRIAREQVVKIEQLESLTYRNGKKITIQDQKLKQEYHVLANIMDVDIASGKADFSTVSDRILDQKEIILEKVKLAKKECDQNHFQMCDATDRFNQSKSKLTDLEEQLRRNDSVSKHWLFMAPTIISRALEAQSIKVENVNDSVGVKAQLGRVTEPDTFKNQFNQAKKEHLPSIIDYETKIQSIKLKEDPENFVDRFKQLNESQDAQRQLKVRRRKGKCGLISNTTPGNEQLMKNIKRKLLKFKGKSFFLEKPIDSRMQIQQTQTIATRDTENDPTRLDSHVVKVLHLNETKYMESPREQVDSYDIEIDNFYKKRLYQAQY